MFEESIGNVKIEKIVSAVSINSVQIMYRHNSVCKNCGKSNSQSAIKTKSFYTRFRNISSRNISTQTNAEDVCKEHNQQITQLLTEVAIALRHKAKLENQIVKLKTYSSELEYKLNESQGKVLQEIDKLKQENLQATLKISTLKISHLGEQNDLLNQVSNLKSQLQELNQEKENICQIHSIEKQNLEHKMKSNTDELQKEVEKNSNLKLKVTKYRTKFKNFLNYIQNLLEESKENKNEQTARESQKYNYF